MAWYVPIFEISVKSDQLEFFSPKKVELVNSKVTGRCYSSQQLVPKEVQHILNQCTLFHHHVMAWYVSIFEISLKVDQLEFFSP
jgi:hypothetical protein